MRNVLALAVLIPGFALAQSMSVTPIAPGSGLNAGGDGYVIYSSPGTESVDAHWRASGGSFGTPDVYDNVMQIGWNCEKVDDSASHSFCQQMEYRYRPTDADSTVTEYILGFTNADGTDRRLVQTTTYLQGALANETLWWFKALETKFYDSTGNTTLAHFDAANVKFVLDSAYITGLTNNTKYYKQKDSGGTDRALMYLDSGDRIRLGDETSPLQTSVMGKLAVGVAAISGNAWMYVTPTITAANAGGTPATYFGPVVTPASGAGNIYGSEWFLNATTPSATAVDTVASLLIDAPTITIGGGGATVTNAAGLVVSAPSTGTNKYAILSTGTVKTTGNFEVNSSGKFVSTGNGTFGAVADGTWLLTDSTGTTGRIQLGKNASGGMLIRNGSSEAYFRTFDDSAYANIEAGTIWGNSSPSIRPLGALGIQFSSATVLDGNNTDGKMTMTTANAAAGFTLDGTSDAVMNVQARDGSSAATIKSAGLISTTLEADLTAGSCTAGTWKVDNNSTRELCRCNDGGTAYDCISVTTANGPTN